MLYLTAIGLAAGLLAAAPVKKKRNKDFGPVTDEQKKLVVENMKQLMLAMHNYECVYGTLPTDTIDAEDKPLLSWRVHLLPYLEELPLYEQFKLDEAWDSANNKPLLEKMPKIFAPVRVETEEPYCTFLQGFLGDDALFHTDRTKKRNLIAFIDGIANTVGLVEAKEPLPWSKPGDIPFDSKTALPELGGQLGGDFYIALCDCSVRFVNSKTFKPEAFKEAITISGGEVLNVDEAFGK